MILIKSGDLDYFNIFFKDRNSENIINLLIDIGTNVNQKDYKRQIFRFIILI